MFLGIVGMASAATNHIWVTNKKTVVIGGTFSAANTGGNHQMDGFPGRWRVQGMYTGSADSGALTSQGVNQTLISTSRHAHNTIEVNNQKTFVVGLTASRVNTGANFQEGGIRQWMGTGAGSSYAETNNGVNIVEIRVR